VLDSSVVISGFRSRRVASYRLLDLAAGRQLVLLATPALFLEYEDVLKRPEQRKVSGLTLAQVDTALAALAAAGWSQSRCISPGGPSLLIPTTKWCWMQQ